jgi:hypothetical protein
MWPEPLTAPVARVRCAHGTQVPCGIFGEMKIVDDRGAPRQRARALVLLVQEALRYAASIGITRVETEAPPRLHAFAARMCDLSPRADGHFAGELHAVRSHNLRHTDSNGEER